jgi:Ca2+-transporting ATPase
MQKSMSYILAVHVPIAGMALLPVLLGYPAMLFPMHIAFLELIIDPACSLAFENEPAEADSMQRSPRDPDAPLFGGSTLWLALLQGLGVLAVVMGAYAFAQGGFSEPAARAFAFIVLVTANLALIFANRSRSRPLLASLRTPNPVLWIVSGLTMSMLALSLYLPVLAGLFRFAPLPLPESSAAFGLGLVSVAWFQLLKWRSLRVRLVWIALALLGGAAASASLGLSPWMDRGTCSLCVLHRLLFMLIAALALFAALPPGPRARWLPGGLATGLAAVGLGLAGYQIWLQFQPSSACVGGLAGFIDPMAGWLGKQAPGWFTTTGFCDATGAALFSLSLPYWNLMVFTACLAIAIWALSLRTTSKPASG